MARRRSRYTDYGSYGGYGDYGGFRPYVSVAERRRLAAHEAQRAKKNGEPLDPVRPLQNRGRQIATTTWGRAWCDHIESFHDYANRLPRGRTYVRNGSVYHLAIAAGEIHARVMGSESYRQRVAIAPCRPATWKRVRKRCAGGIGSLIELLEGRISSAVMAAMTEERDGLLPDLRQVELTCSCPDWALLEQGHDRARQPRRRRAVAARLRPGSRDQRADRLTGSPSVHAFGLPGPTRAEDRGQSARMAP
jgi:hypothetical protein